MFRVLIILASFALFGILVWIDIPPYMDEIFHVGQTKKFFSGKWDEWDDKITTPPGLYIYGVFWTKIFGVFGFVGCETWKLRLINFLTGLGGGLYILRLIAKNSKLVRYEERVIQCILFPLFYFFLYLYYTDCISTLLVFLCYELGRMKRFHLSAFVGLLSLTFRQTNIFWIFFTAGTCVLSDFESFRKKKDSWTDSYFVLWVMQNLSYISKRYWSYVLVGFSFVYFVYWNGGIVLGDRENHEVILHFPQFFYWVVFCGVLQPGMFFVNFFKMLANMKHVVTLPRILAFFSAVLIFGIVSYHFAYVHKFMLSDNRHYVFYLWRRFFEIQDTASDKYRWYAAKYAPLYAGYLGLIWYMLGETQTLLWRILFFTCVAMNMIPMPLVEFRYYVIPTLMVIMHRKEYRSQFEWMNIGFYIVINLGTLYLFLFKPFGDNLQERFMW